jgi:hypothetical protein
MFLAVLQLLLERQSGVSPSFAARSFPKAIAPSVQRIGTIVFE